MQERPRIMHRLQLQNEIDRCRTVFTQQLVMWYVLVGTFLAASLILELSELERSTQVLWVVKLLSCSCSVRIATRNSAYSMAGTQILRGVHSLVSETTVLLLFWESDLHQIWHHFWSRFMRSSEHNALAGVWKTCGVSLQCRRFNLNVIRTWKDTWLLSMIRQCHQRFLEQL